MIFNKQILGQIQETAKTLKDLLDKKNDFLDKAKSELTPDQLKEFQALEKIMNQQLKDKDFNGAFRTIQKYQSKK